MNNIIKSRGKISFSVLTYWKLNSFVCTNTLHSEGKSEKRISFSILKFNFLLYFFLCVLFLIFLSRKNCYEWLKETFTFRVFPVDFFFINKEGKVCAQCQRKLKTCFWQNWQWKNICVFWNLFCIFGLKRSWLH